MTRSASLLLVFSLGAFAAAPDTLRLTLAQAMETSRHGLLSSRIAQSQAREADARADEARSALLPHIGATASDVVRSFNTATLGLPFPEGFTFPRLAKPYNVQDARLVGRVTLWDGSAWKRYRAAKDGAASAQWDQKAEEENASLEGAAAYLALLRARALVTARREEVDLAARLEELSRDQKKAGAATQIEVLRAQSQSASARMALSSATGEELSARYNLLQILGAPLDTPVDTRDSLEAQALDGRLAGAGLDSLSSGRPEVAAARAETQARRSEMDAARAGFLPTLDLAGDYGLNGRRIYTSGAEWTEDVALQLNWNLWDGGGRRARVAQQRERLRQSELRLENTRTDASRAARAQQGLLDAAWEEAARARERVAFSEDEARLAAEKFRSGSSGNLEVITAQASVSAAHAAYVDALYGYNRVRLEYLRSVRRLPGT